MVAIVPQLRGPGGYSRPLAPDPFRNAPTLALPGVRDVGVTPGLQGFSELYSPALGGFSEGVTPAEVLMGKKISLASEIRNPMTGRLYGEKPVLSVAEAERALHEAQDAESKAYFRAEKLKNLLGDQGTLWLDDHLHELAAKVGDAQEALHAARAREAAAEQTQVSLRKSKRAGRR